MTWGQGGRGGAGAAQQNEFSRRHAAATLLQLSPAASHCLFFSSLHAARAGQHLRLPASRERLVVEIPREGHRHCPPELCPLRRAPAAHSTQHTRRCLAFRVFALHAPFAWPIPVSVPVSVPVPRPNPDHHDLVPHAPWHESRITAPGMRRRSSGSSQDGDRSPVEAPHVNSLLTPLALDSRASAPTSQSPSPSSLDRRRSSDKRSGPARSRRSSNVNWKPSELRDASIDSPSRTAHSTSSPALLPANGAPAKEMEKDQESRFIGRRPRLRSPWAITLTTLITSILGIAFLAAVLHSSVTRQLDPKGCRMSYMRPGYARLHDFDTEHTRFASKYSLYLYREQGVEHGTKVARPGIGGVFWGGGC